MMFTMAQNVSFSLEVEERSISYVTTFHPHILDHTFMLGTGSLTPTTKHEGEESGGSNMR